MTVISPENDLAKILGFTPSEEQMAAITAPLEPGMIIAGAGTGKTTVMSARILWLVMTGQVAPQQILGLTFTKKATQELLSRVRAKLPLAVQYVDAKAREQFGEPTILTYNAFGARLLKEHGLRLGYEPDSRVVVDATRYQLAMRVVHDTTLDLGESGQSAVKAVSNLMKLDEQCSNYLVEPELLIEHQQDRNAQLQAIEPKQSLVREMLAAGEERIALAKLVQEFRAAKKRHGIIDYSDQIRLAAQIAKSSPEVGQLLREQFAVVLLDEYQDTSVSQKELLTALFGQGHPVMAVGDPCQAIYRWRGAEIKNMESFASDFSRIVDGIAHKAQSFNLTANRRSGQQVLTVANEVSNPLRGIHRSVKELVVGDKKKHPGEVHVSLHETFADEVHWVAEQISQLKPEGSWSDVAILMRDKRTTKYFVAALEELNIPVQVTSADALLDLPEVREIVSYLQVMTDPCANAALARILLGPRFRIGTRDMALLGGHARKLVAAQEEHANVDLQLDAVVAGVDRAERVSLLDALELAATTNDVAYSPEAKERFTLLAQELRYLRQHVGDSAIDAIHRVIRTTGISIEALTRHATDGSGRFDRIASLIELAGEFRNLEGDSSLSAFMVYLRDSERFTKDSDPQLPIVQDAVVVMTVHQAKGLEFPIVVIPNMAEGSFPTDSRARDGHWPTSGKLLPPLLMGKDQDDPLTAFPAVSGPRKVDFETYKSVYKEQHLTDECRLAYVAITRAEQMVIASASWWGPTQKEARGPSSYINALKTHATKVGPWVEQSAHVKNPALDITDYPSWPRPVDVQQLNKLQKAADLVRKYLNPQGNAQNFATGNDAAEIVADDMLEKLIVDEGESTLAKQWEDDIAVLLSHVDSQSAPTKVVSLPASLSASQTMALVADEQAFLRSLVRPMPRQPSPAASRGTRFHAWVESFYGQRPLIEDDDMPGAIDSEIYDDKQLAQLKQAFESGIFAQRTPVHLEEPFALVVGGHTLRGRIDAIFAGNLNQEHSSESWTVVDWKTGKPGSADDLQLSIYRLALAQLKGVDPQQVEAAFYYVAQDELHVPQRYWSFEELCALFG